MTAISAVIITHNEEKNIERCLLSLMGVVDDIVVLDSFSADRTQEICEKYGVRFFQHHFDTYGDQKDRATRHAKYDDVLSLDADEALDDILRNSILKVKPNLENAYYLSRLTNYCGHWVWHGAWYPDRKLRLFNRTKGEWVNRSVHEEWKLYEAKSRRHILEGHLLHYGFPDLKTHYRKIELYSNLSSKKPSIFKQILNPMWCFFVGFFLRRGFLDGRAGFNIARLSAFSVYIKYKWKNID